MPAAFIEKAGMELVGAFVKTVGLEAGKRVINGKPQKPKENHLTEIKEVKESVEIVNCSYDWEAIDRNVDKISEYAKLLAPVAGATMAGFVFLPVLAGATTFALAGTGAAALVYTVTNGTVVLGGLYEASRRIQEHYAEVKNGQYCLPQIKIYERK